MNELLKALMNRNGYMAPAGEDGAAAGGGSADRGDSLNLPDTKVEDTAPEPKAEEKAEEKDEDKEETTARDDKGRFIPKERFDEAVKKERGEKEELARRLKAFEDREAQNKVADDFAQAQKLVKDMIKQHTSLLADGEIDKAADLMEKILDLKEAVSERKAESRAMSAKDQAKEEVRYDATVAKLESDYPQINPEHEDFDKTAVKRIQALMTGLIQNERMSASKALVEAVETIMGKPKKDDAPAKDKADEMGMRRKEEAVKKAVEASKKQPASTKDVGLDHDKEGGPLDASAVMKMSWDEFIKLPDAKLSELRGDFV